MKKLIALFSAIVMLVCCASGRYISTADPQNAFDAEQVLYNTRPELVPYYEAGVLKITSMREVVGRDGSVSYNVKYRFVKRHIKDYSERMACLKENFPELYQMYVNGTIEIYSLYAYVDDNGVIRHHVSYRRLYDFYYDYAPLMYPYGGYRYYYRPRVSPPPPRRGNIGPGHNPPPPQRPDVRPNNPPRPQGGNPPRQGGNPNVSPNRGGNPPSGSRGGSPQRSNPPQSRGRR